MQDVLLTDASTSNVTSAQAWGRSASFSNLFGQSEIVRLESRIVYQFALAVRLCERAVKPVIATFGCTLEGLSRRVFNGF